jgi:hypothetical protein
MPLQPPSSQMFPNASQFPPYLRCVTDALHRIPL